MKANLCFLKCLSYNCFKLLKRSEVVIYVCVYVDRLAVLVLIVLYTQQYVKLDEQVATCATFVCAYEHSFCLSYGSWLLLCYVKMESFMLV